VDIEEVNVVNAHLLQAALEAFAEEFGAVVGADVPLALVVDGEFDAELGGQENVGAALGVQLEPLADQGLAVAVAAGRVPVRVAELPGAVQKRQTLFVSTEGVSEQGSV
jgi:DNA-binding transcriptional regulator LsrR (DeoR family)